MTLLLALAVGISDCCHLKMGNGHNGIYGAFPDDVRAQYVAWAVSLPVGPFPFEQAPLPRYF